MPVTILLQVGDCETCFTAQRHFALIRKSQTQARELRFANLVHAIKGCV